MPADPEVSTPEMHHQALAEQTAKELENIGIIPTTPADVMSHSPSDQPLEPTNDLKAVGAEVVEVTSNFFQDKKQQFFGSSKNASVISYGDAKKDGAIVEERINKEKM
jgi:hypothetical protein